MITIDLKGDRLLKDKLKKLQREVKIAAQEAIKERTEEMYTNIRRRVSGQKNARGKLIGMYRRVQPDNSGTGKEIFPLNTQDTVINLQKSKFRRGIKQATSEPRPGLLQGEVGFDSSYDGTNRAYNSRIDWPNRPIYDSVVITKLQPFTVRDKDLKRERENVTSYAQKVILGTSTMIGRNIFRMEILEDINQNKTISRLEKKLMDIFSHYA